MKRLDVTTPVKQYPIYITDGFDALDSAFDGIKASKVCIITDSNIAPLYLDEVKQILAKRYEVCSYIFEAGEKSKNIATICDFYSYFVQEHLDRKSVLVALGGGVTGDMTGFAAATYMRGIRFVQIPTTILAQVDSSVGGKTGIDFEGNKNMVGAFYQPEFVYINLATLKSLPSREVSAGIAEAIKTGYIIDKPLLDYFFENKEKIKLLDNEAVAHIIYSCCKDKAYVVDKDEKELGLRAILNFGHTFGHAVETLLGFRLLHGECVAVGMMAAMSYSASKYGISEADIYRCRELLEYFDLPVSCELNQIEIFEQMFLDKKTSAGHIKIVALNELGNAVIDDKADEADIKAAIETIIK